MSVEWRGDVRRADRDEGHTCRESEAEHTAFN